MGRILKKKLKWIKKLRVFKLRKEASGEDLAKGLEKLKEELNSLRVAKVAGGTSSKLGRIGVVRKAIAKYLTLINEKCRKELKDRFKDKPESKKPYAIRAKRTRAIRRKLDKSQLKKKTIRKWKQVKNFPVRKFALRD